MKCPTMNRLTTEPETNLTMRNTEHTMDKHELEHAERHLDDALTVTDELAYHTALTEDEQRTMEEAMRNIRSVYDDVQARKTIAGVDWELVEENLDEMAELVEAVREELPEPEEVETEGLPLLVVNMMSEVDRDLHEARSGTRDILD